MQLKEGALSHLSRGGKSGRGGDTINATSDIYGFGVRQTDQHKVIR